MFGSRYSFLALLPLASALGCFAPPRFENKACSDEGKCPEGLICAPEGVCLRSDEIETDLPPDAADGSGIDHLEPPHELVNIADSVADFSNVQGQGGWSYGFMPEGDGAKFTRMMEFVAGKWRVDQRHWTFLAPELAHPNAVMTTGGREAVNQWAVRRWTSPIAGKIVLAGKLAKSDTSPHSNGVIGRILIDGREIWQRQLAGTDGVGVVYTITTTVSEGSTVDLAVDPIGHDYNDMTRFSVVVLH